MSDATSDSDSRRTTPTCEMVHNFNSVWNEGNKEISCSCSSCSVSQRAPTAIYALRMTIASDIVQKFENKRETSLRQTKKEELRAVIWRLLVIKYNRRSQVYMIGSSIHNDAVISDLDLCVIVPTDDTSQHDYSEYAKLNIISHLLQSIPHFRNFRIAEIDGFILTFSDKYSKIKIHIRLNKKYNILSSRLIKNYTLSDDRVSQLIFIAKEWAKGNGLINMLSGFTITLMVIAFLQAGCTPPVCRSYQSMLPQYFHDDLSIFGLSSVAPLPVIEGNHETIDELFIGFLHFYTNLNYTNVVVSVRVGAIVEAKNAETDYIYVEEPYAKVNVSDSVCQADESEYIKKIFGQDYMKLITSLQLSAVVKAF